MAVTADEKQNSTVEISRLRFTYPGIDGHPPPGSKPLIEDFSITLKSTDWCLLVGSNGSGKTTILKILGGKHMVEPHVVRVLGGLVFHDIGLTSSGDLCYLGGEDGILLMVIGRPEASITGVAIVKRKQVGLMSFVEDQGAVKLLSWKSYSWCKPQ